METLTRPQAKILTHVRCHLEDAKIAVETGVDGVSLGNRDMHRHQAYALSLTSSSEPRAICANIPMART